MGSGWEFGMNSSLDENMATSGLAPGCVFHPGFTAMAPGPVRVAWLGLATAEHGHDSDELRSAGIFQAGSRFAVTVFDDPLFFDPKKAQPRFDTLLVAGAALSEPRYQELCIASGLPVLVLGNWCIDAGHATFYSIDEPLPFQAGAVERLDRRLEEVLQSRSDWPDTRAVTQAGQNILILVPHRPKQDPRLSWIAAGAPSPLRVHQLGVHPAHENKIEQAFDGREGLVASVPMHAYRHGEAVLWGARCGANAGAQAAVGQLLWMERALALPDEAYLRAVGAWVMGERALILRDLFRYFLNVSATLVHEASRLRGIDCVIAADLPTLPAALMLGAIFKAKVVFDAHEYWAEADLGAADFEIQLWARVERLLLPHADLRFTVSTGLARMMEASYGVPVGVLPNAEPKSEQRRMGGHKPDGVCDFLFQGGFARGRGIELLIDAWPDVAESAHLHLRGPLGDWRDRMLARAAATGLLNKRIFFPLPVDESELVDAAARFHVGLIPYEPHGANHQHCCPNKMSQYMAAGLPMLANETSYVGEVIRRADAGLVVDFRDRQALARAVNLLASDPVARERFARNSADHSLSTFHWEAVSVDFYQDLGGLLADRPSRPLQWFGPGRGVADDVSVTEFDTSRQLGLGLRSLLLRVGHVVWSNTPPPLRRRLKPFADMVWRRLQGI